MKKEKSVRAILVASAFFGFTWFGTAGADEASAIAGGTHWFWQALSLPETESVIAAAITLLAGLAARWGWVRKWRLDRAVECLAAGVRETYEEYVREIKKASEDGKLTDEERSFAMRMALEKAKSYALNAGFDLLKVYAEEYLPVLVERIIGSQKAVAKGETVVV